jgi:CBS domain-containing protein
MTRDIVTLRPGMPVHEAWQMMLHNKIKALPVVDTDDKVVGILTDGDLLERAGIQQRLSVAVRLDETATNGEIDRLAQSTLLVLDVMTKPVITIRDDDSLGLATTKMVKAGLKRLPVIDSTQKLVGMLSRLDILRQVAQTTETMHTQPGQNGPGRTVADVMTTDIPMVNQDDDLSTMIEKFAMTDSHRLIVVDADKKPIGLISDSDIVARVQPVHRQSILDSLRRIGKPPAGKETALELMSQGVLTVPPETSIVSATRIMLAEARKWVVVVDENQHPLGLVDRQILLEAMVTLKG